MKRYAVVIERTGSGYSAYAPDLPGCVAAGRTVQAVQRAMEGAIRLHIAGLREDGLPVPVPAAKTAYIAAGGARRGAASGRRQPPRAA